MREPRCIGQLGTMSAVSPQWQTGSQQSTPQSKIRTKPSRILSERDAHTEFQYRPHIVDTDAVFANAVSETSKQLSTFHS